MRKLFVLSAIVLISPLYNYAQQDLSGRQRIQIVPRRTPTLSFGMQLAVPTGEFAENYGGKPFGINAALSVPLASMPIEVGGGFSWNHMGGNNSTVPILGSDGTQQSGTLTVNGNAYAYFIHGRLRPFNGRFRPYGELFTGVRNFALRSKLKADIGGSPTKENISRNLTGIAGYAIGAKYAITEGIFLEGRFERMAGSKTDYVDTESISINQQTGAISYRTLSSRTDQWAISLGVAFSF